MKKTLLITLVPLSLFLSGQCLAEKDGYYRWRDDRGSLHFSQQPPMGRNYEFVEKNKTTQFSDDREADVEATIAEDTVAEGTDAEPGTTVPSEADSGDKLETLPPRNPALCEQARQNLQALSVSGVRIRGTKADGTSYYLSPEEIETQRQRSRQAEELQCEP